MTNMRLLGLVVATAGAVVGAMLGGEMLWLHYLCKPLATVLILWQAVVAIEPDPRYRRLIVLGLGCSLVGDIALMLPGDHFVAGLAAFLVAHLFYISALLPQARLARSWPAVLMLAAYSVINLFGLWPHLQAGLKGPVVAYVAVLAVMAAAALARSLQISAPPVRRNAARLAAIGGVLFIASDSLLAWARFAGVVPLPDLLILVTYFGAQWCIARSVSASAKPAR